MPTFRRACWTRRHGPNQSALASNPDDLVVKERLLELKAIQGRIRRGLLGPVREWETHVTKIG